MARESRGVIETPRRNSPEQREATDGEIENFEQILLESEWDGISDNNSTVKGWNTLVPPVKNGDDRFCVDFRKLNCEVVIPIVLGVNKMIILKQAHFTLLIKLPWTAGAGPCICGRP